jgi:hypothetical protein
MSACKQVLSGVDMSIDNKEQPKAIPSPISRSSLRAGYARMYS